MQIEVWFTTQATDEAAGMTSRWYAWPLLLLGNLQGVALVAALLIGGCVIFVKGVFTARPDLSRAALGIVMVVVPVVGFRWSLRHERRKADEELAAINPQKLTFDADGLHTLEKTGASSFVPWSSFTGFREGKAVILLRDAGSAKNYRMIPKKTVPESGVEQMRSSIREHLPEIH